jgi:tetratricopeptide (TPR) repeat protein
MAETITLRAYLDDVNNLLERGAATETISHCRYILQHYPRNVETYRLLAQALLQKAQDQGIESLYAEAAEVLQRVLGVTPNDYVAHLGLSEIREHEDQLDQAIWHMERAYEQIPGNQMLQAALRGLYAKRDGKDRAPEKIHLTQGALARQYVNAQLYDQALIELRHALEQNPSRLDLQVMLAETLWESHHPVEAGESALQILKKLPDCLPANRILARLWLDNERPTDAQVFLDRVEALDPYAAAEVLQPDAHVPDPNLLTRLDYSTEAQVTLSQTTPDWIQDLGDMNGADVGNVFQAPPAAPPAAEAAGDEGASFDWLQGVSEAADQDVPDWFSAVGQETPEASSDQPVPGAAWLSEPTDVPGADLPDWFSELGGPSESSEPADQPPLEADWLTELDDVEELADLPGEAAEPEGAAPAEPDSGLEADWLADFGALDLEEPSSEGLAEGKSVDVPSWDDAGEEEPLEAASDLDWLEEDVSVPETLAEELPETPVVEEDWMSGFDAVDISSFETVEEQEPSALDWFAEETVQPQAETQAEPETGAEPSEEADWPAEKEADAFSEEAAEAGASDAQPSSGFTDLLAGIEPGHMAMGQAEEVDDIEIIPPEWLAAFGEEDSTSDQEEETSRSPEAEEESPGWLAADQPASEAEQAEYDSWSWEEAEQPAEAEVVSGPDLDALSLDSEEEGPPVAMSEEAGTEATPEWAALPQEDIPDWLTEPESDFFALPSARPQEEPPSEDIEDWFSELEEVDDSAGVSLADLAEEAAPEASEHAQRSEVIGDEADWFDEEDEAVDDAGLMAILAQAEDELALPEIELEDQEEILAADLPDWIREASPDAQESVAAEVPVDEGVQVEEVEEIAGAAEESLAPFEAAEAETPEIADLVQPDAGVELEIGEPVGEEVLDWLEPQAAEDDWLGAFAMQRAEAAEPEAPEPEEALTFAVEEEPEAVESPVRPEPTFETDEWSAMMPDTEFEAMSGAEETFAEVESAPPVPESEAAPSADVGEDYGDVVGAEETESSPMAGDVPAWMDGLEPVELEEAPASEEADLFDQPYDPFEGGSPDKVPEYQSAKETGILQPYESPDWMTAFGDEEVPIELDEAADIEIDFGEEESFLSALGIESAEERDIEEESEAEMAYPGSGGIADGLMGPGIAEAEDYDLDTAAPVDEDLASLAEEEGQMPDWLAAITSSATEQFDDLLFEEPAPYSSSAEASGIVPESELDWLGPLGEEIEMEQPSGQQREGEGIEEDLAEAPLDLDAIFAQTEPVASDRDELAPGEADIFDFDFPETEVAQPSDLAHTKELEVEEEETPWSDDESVPDDFAFDELVPRWLRRPKESDQGTSSRQHDNTASGKPDWLRNVFDDEESND